MQKVKEVAEISKEIIQKLDQAIAQTINARIFYEKYKSLLVETKRILLLPVLASMMSW
jgi:hypothetical protein